MPATDSSSRGTPPVLAGGQPISGRVADQAAQWLTLLMSGDATDEDRRRWQQWRAGHPDHERAWRHIESVTGRLGALQPQAAYQSLSAYAAVAQSPARRRTLKLLAWGASGVAALSASRTRPWQQLMADYRTGMGEQRELDLEDGTRIALNTDSAIDVRFDAGLRLVNLVAGEIMVSTGHAPGFAARPFIVQTDEGRIRALGTRFSVRRAGGSTRVAVLESAVEITPAGGAGHSQVLRAGWKASFTRATLGGQDPLALADTAWTRGQIVADNMPLADFLAELSRYRSGFVHCAPAVASLPLSGVFPLGDTDSILSALPEVLPVRVRMTSRYWVAVEAAP